MFGNLNASYESFAADYANLHVEVQNCYRAFNSVPKSMDNFIANNE
jgi:hypothetical protein